MMKVLYIHKRGPHNIAARTHLSVLQSIYGKENIWIVDLLSPKAEKREQFISYGYTTKNVFQRVLRYLQGNTTFLNNEMIGGMCRVVQTEKIGLVFSEESDMGNLFRAIKQVSPETKIICFFHDISADLFQKRIQDCKPSQLHVKLEYKRVIHQERAALEYMDEKWVFNDADAARLKMHYGCKPDAVIPMGAPVPQINADYAAKVTANSALKQMLFVCSSYYVNIDGFNWFYKNVFPYLEQQCQIDVVGDGALKLRGNVDENRIRLVGRVDSMVPYYENADIVIAPVFDGGGMKVKTIEAYSLGKCMISTAESLNGYWEGTPEELRGNLIYRCNTAPEWIEACNFLMKKEIHRFNAEVFEVFKASFSEEALLANFKKQLKV